LAPRAAAKLAKARLTLPWAKILIPCGEIFQQRRPDRIDFLAKSVISGSLLWLRPEAALGNRWFTSIGGIVTQSEND
jgi:hypothetical protein